MSKINIFIFAFVFALVAIFSAKACQSPTFPEKALTASNIATEAPIRVVNSNRLPKNIDRVLNYQITAYCLKGIMASGKQVYDGAIACPRSMSLGTEIVIQNKIYICEDRLSLQYDYRYDIWFEDCQEALNWGIKKLPLTTK